MICSGLVLVAETLLSNVSRFISDLSTPGICVLLSFDLIIWILGPERPGELWALILVVVIPWVAVMLTGWNPLSPWLLGIDRRGRPGCAR
ncbi:hypothetical protein [Cryobacterium sp. Y11]|uniref:hypothetical protein n=1 Tax=Cryobacterium sp. Y11 TaxID=2045016 RepID=UPI000CE51BFB|nr:hypothetical protein [Cryobacterium sp. Y11]